MSGPRIAQEELTQPLADSGVPEVGADGLDPIPHPRVLKVSEVADLLDIPVRRLKYLRERGHVVPSAPGGKGNHATYTPEDILRAKVILSLDTPPDSLQIPAMDQWGDQVEVVLHGDVKIAVPVGEIRDAVNSTVDRI
jgi:hypothetical protein